MRGVRQPDPYPIAELSDKLTTILGDEITNQSDFLASILGDFYADLIIYKELRVNEDISLFEGETVEERTLDRDRSIRDSKAKLICQLFILEKVATNKNPDLFILSRLIEDSYIHFTHTGPPDHLGV